MLSTSGCGSGPTDQDQRWLETIACVDDAGEGDGAVVAPLDGGLDGSSPAGEPDASADAVPPKVDGAYFASVSANGTGCPAGTTSTRISPDGETFRIEFSAFEVNVTKDTPERQITRNCQLAIKLHTPIGLSYAVRSFAYQGYAFLEEGVQASQWARYYFQGNPVPPSNSNRVVLTGPYDSDFGLRDVVETADTVWSRCGTNHDLNVYTSLQVENSEPKRAGYASVHQAADIELAFRSCNGAPLPTPN